MSPKSSVIERKRKRKTHLCKIKSSFLSLLESNHHQCIQVEPGDDLVILFQYLSERKGEDDGNPRAASESRFLFLEDKMVEMHQFLKTHHAWNNIHQKQLICGRDPHERPRIMVLKKLKLKSSERWKSKIKSNEIINSCWLEKQRLFYFKSKAMENDNACLLNNQQSW